MFLPVHDDSRDLLVEEDEDGRQQGRRDCHGDQPDVCYFERINDPASVVSCSLQTQPIHNTSLNRFNKHNSSESASPPLFYCVNLLR